MKSYLFKTLGISKIGYVNTEKLSSKVYYFSRISLLKLDSAVDRELDSAAGGLDLSIDRICLVRFVSNFVIINLCSDKIYNYIFKNENYTLRRLNFANCIPSASLCHHCTTATHTQHRTKSAKFEKNNKR